MFINESNVPLGLYIYNDTQNRQQTGTAIIFSTLTQTYPFVWLGMLQAIVLGLYCALYWPMALHCICLQYSSSCGAKLCSNREGSSISHVWHPEISLTAARLQCWALLLFAYNYTIEFRPTAAHANADGLSRLPLTFMHPVQIFSETSVFNVAQIMMLPLSFLQLEQATRTDPVLGQVYQFIQQGWPEKVPDSLKPFWQRRLELTTEGGCVLWSIRVVVPQKFRNDTIKMLHAVHAGIVRMKEIARSYVW